MISLNKEKIVQKGQAKNGISLRWAYWRERKVEEKYLLEIVDIFLNIFLNIGNNYD